MNLINAHKSWLFAVVCGVSLVGAAVMAERESAPEEVTAHSVQDLSHVFREISHEALPSVVSIDTISRESTVQSAPNDVFAPDGPFGDFFRNDPDLREFFRNRKQLPRQAPRSIGRGSGWIIDESGWIVTSAHVVRNAEEVRVRLYDGRVYSGRDVRIDSRTDVAVLRIDAEGEKFKPLPMGNSDEMQIGDWVMAVGSPLGQDLSVTQGIISGKGRGPQILDREDFLQTDAAINPGNSGGPLLNLKGEVIGINAAISTRGGGSDGIGFAIPINMARWVVGQLLEAGEVTRAYLGVGVHSLDNELAEQFNLESRDGAVVSTIQPDSPADLSGLKQGDVILKLDGKPIPGPKVLQDVVEKLEIDKTYQMDVLRQGDSLQLDVTVRKMPSDFTRTNSLTRRSQPTEPEEIPSEELGIAVSELTPDVAEQLGYDRETKGVVVTKVAAGSLAESAGIQRGMVIKQIGNKRAGHTPVSTPEEFSSAIENLSLEDGLLLLTETPTGGARYYLIEKR